MYFDGVSTTRLTNNNLFDGNSQIFGSNAVWRGFDGNDGEIYFYDGVSVTQLTNNDFDDFRPLISGTNIVWGDATPTGREIFFYDGINTTQVTNDGFDNFARSISGSSFVWAPLNDGARNVRLARRVPEPTTIALFTLGLLGTALTRRRRKAHGEAGGAA